MKKNDRQLFAEKFARDLIFVQTTNDDLTPFDRIRIVAVLLNETDVEYSFAVKISEEIQETIFASNLKVVTSEFVRELVNAKLIEYKLDKAREKNKRLGLSLYDVGLLLKYPLLPNPNFVHTPSSTSFVIADNVKRQFVLSELLTEDLVNGHIMGDYHIQGISHPDKLIEIYVDCCDFLEFSFASGAVIIVKPQNIEQFVDNLIKIHMLLTDYSLSGICWFNIEKAFEFFNKNKTENVEYLKKIVKNISNVAVKNVPYSIFLEEKLYVEELILFVEINKFFNVELKTNGNNYFPSPFLTMFNGDINNTCFFGEVVTLNLPRIALKKIEEGVEFERELDELLSKISKIFSKKQLFIQKLSAVRPNGSFEFLGKAGLSSDNLAFGIAVNGLNEWGKLLFGGNSTIDQSILASDHFMKILKQKIVEVSNKKKLNISLISSSQEDIGYKFARMDLKFYSYLVSKVVSGSISKSTIYYTRDCCLPSSLPIPINKKIHIESEYQKYFDVPFKTVLKSVKNHIEKNIENFTKSKHLFLTLDFSLCYNCMTISQGIYQTCPECFGTELERYVTSYKGFVPLSRLNNAFREETESYIYYI